MRTRRILFVVLSFLLALAVVSAATRTFYVEETDFVKITPEGVDLDNDKITYSYSAPLDEKGEWQTNYEDSGEYKVSIFASDGIEQTEEKVNIIVKNKNQGPYLKEKSIVAQESQQVDLKSLVEDPDGDALKYTFFAPFDKNGLWQTDFEDEGLYFAEFIVSDGQYSITARANIEILPTNEPPIIKEVFSEEEEIRLIESEDLKYFVKAIDNDGDQITYLWKFNNKLINTESEGVLNFDYSSAGKHLLELTVDDGFKQKQRFWQINVKNKNRQPDVKINSVSVKEGELVVLNFPKTDLDGDILSYSFAAPLDVEGKWQTTFNDSGKYFLKVEANDGELTGSSEVEITIQDVDRSPILAVPAVLEVKEGKTLTWKVKVNDPDEDIVNIKIDGAPDGAIFNQETKTFSWSPDYDFIKRRHGFISNVLNSLRLENKFLKSRKNTMTINACGKKLCTLANVELITFNVNRGPVFNEQEIIFVNETNELKLEVTAVDPDGDIVKYFYPNPLTRRGGKWKTDFEDQGNYTFFVSATDGDIEEIIPINVVVLKKNREPSVTVSTEKALVNEGEEFTIFVNAQDPDNDDIDITLDFLPFGAEFRDGVFVWTPNFNNIENKTNSLKNNLVKNSDYLNRRFNSEKKVYWLTFSADDGETITKHPVQVIVKNKNRNPELIDAIPEKVLAKINEPIVFEVIAGDQDNDNLEYKWNFGFGETSVGGTNAIERTFIVPGDKKVTVEISDGRDTIIKSWNVKIINEHYTKPTIPMNFGNVKVYVVDY